MIYLGSLPCFFPRCYDYSHLWALVFKCSKASYELGEFQPQVTENLPQTNLNNVKLDQHYWKSRCRLELWVDLISWLHFPRVLSDPLVYVRRGGGGHYLQAERELGCHSSKSHIPSQPCGRLDYVSEIFTPTLVTPRKEQTS